MRKIFSFLALISIFAYPALTQVNFSGLPIIRNFSPAEMNASEQNYSVIQDKRGVVYVGTNDDGILEYDGTTWRKIPVPNNSSVFSLAMDENGIIYAGSIGEFGFLEPDDAGLMHYRSLIDKVDTADRNFSYNVWKTYYSNGSVFFHTTRKLFKYDYTDSITVYQLPANSLFSFPIDDKIYLGNFLEGLMEFKDDTFEVVMGGEQFNRINIFGILPWQDKLLITTRFSGLFTFDPATGVLEDDIIPTWANDICKEYQAYSSVPLPGGGFLITTLQGGGSFLLDKKLRVRHHLTTENGLDEEILTDTYSGNSDIYESPTWYATADGMAKAEFNNPIRKFDNIHGIAGFILDITRFKGKLYIATFAGTYLLEESEQHDQQLKMIDSTANKVSWALLPYTDPATGNENLLIGTSDGIYEVSDRYGVRLFDDRLLGKREATSKINTTALYVHPDHPNIIFVGSVGGLTTLTFNPSDRRWYKNKFDQLQEEVRSIVIDDTGDFWVGTYQFGIKKISIEDGDTTITAYAEEQGLANLKDNNLFWYQGRILVGTANGFYSYDEANDIFVADPTFGPTFSDGSHGIFRFTEDIDGDVWIFSYTEGLEKRHDYERLIKQPDGSFRRDSISLNRLPNVWGDALYSDVDGLVWFGISDGLYSYDKTIDNLYGPEQKYRNQPYYTLIREVSIDQDTILYSGNYYAEVDGQRMVSLDQPEKLVNVLPFNMRNLDIKWSAPFFEGEERLVYSYNLHRRNRRGNWSRWSTITEFPFYNLNPGHYSLEVKARNVYGIESESGTYRFTIKPPIYRSIIAFILYGLLAILIVYIIVRLNARRLVREKIRLEGIVAQRTAEVVKQKDEIEDSIHYASRIQQALLPSDKVMEEQLPESFIFFRPRDIVSGDFYWMSTKEDKTFIVAADCTGHGVPGAFMSMLGISFLNEIVNISEDYEADKILDHLRNLVMSSLKQTGKDDETKDGMDVALLVFDKATNTVDYAGAYNPLYLVRPLTREELDRIAKGEDLLKGTKHLHNEKHILLQYDADKMPIGISIKKQEHFTKQTIRMEKGSSYYIFSDGYVDQFGGSDGKKFMSRKLKNLLLSVQDQPMSKQRDILEKSYHDWKGQLDQVDDIIVIGIKL